MSKIENIKYLYSRVDKKGAFILKASEHFKMKPMSIKSNWLCDSGFWSIPEKKQDQLIDLLQKQINLQEIKNIPQN